MSTRCQIEILDGTFEERQGRGVLLYHHADGYPSFQLVKLRKFLDCVREFLTEARHPYWWDPERVAATMILLSAQGYDAPGLLSADALLQARSEGRQSWCSCDESKFPREGVPVYQPCRQWHWDIDYIYIVELSGSAYPNADDTREYKIRIFIPNHYFRGSGGDVPYGEEITDTWERPDGADPAG